MGLALQAAILLIIGWLPGAVIYRAPILDRDRRAALDAEERAFWAVILSVALSLACVLALAAAHAYSFTRLVLIDVALASAGAGIWRRRLLMPSAPRPRLGAIIPVLLVLLGAWRFFPPSEYIIGGKDPGVYMNEGIQIAQRGSLVSRDEVVATLPAAMRGLFFPRHVDVHGNPHPDYYSTRFMGFFLLDPDAGLVIGQFPHLLPASLALGYGVDGLTGARRATGVWGILGLVSVYFAGRRLLGSAAAGAASALLALHVVQVWFARYPNAEIVMQALLFAALLANARAHVDGIRFFAPVAGGLLGLLLFLRVDTALAVAAVLVAGALGAVAARPLTRAFWVSLAVPAALAALYMVGPMRPHWDRYEVFLSTLGLLEYGAAAVAGAAVWLVLARGGRMTALSDPLRRLLPLALAVMVTAAALYALFVRQPGGLLAAHDAYALRTFANVYFTVPGVLAAVLGFALLARARFWHDPALFLTIAVFAVSVFYKIRIVPEHFWMARRFLPVVLPGALLLVCGAAFATAGPGRWSRGVRSVAGGVLVLLLASNYVRASRPVLPHSEYEGLIPSVEALAARFTPRDLLVVESRDAGGDVHTLATPLAYIYAKHVLLLASAKPEKEPFAAFIDWARGRYERVFFIGGGGTDVLSSTYALRPVAADRFGVPEFERTTDVLPRSARRKDFEFGVYQFVDPVPEGGDGPFDLDIGAGDDLHVLRFHAREQVDGRTFRWTQRSSYVSVTPFPPDATDLTLVLHDGGRPPAAPPPRVEVFLNGERLGTVEVAPGGFRPYTLALPEALVRRASAARTPVELRLTSTTWRPLDVVGAPDERQLGVMLDRVTIK